MEWCTIAHDVIVNKFIPQLKGTSPLKNKEYSIDSVNPIHCYRTKKFQIHLTNWPFSVSVSRSSHGFHEGFRSNCPWNVCFLYPSPPIQLELQIHPDSISFIFQFFICRKREVNLKVLKVPEIEQKVMISQDSDCVLSWFVRLLRLLHDFVCYVSCQFQLVALVIYSRWVPSTFSMLQSIRTWSIVNLSMTWLWKLQLDSVCFGFVNSVGWVLDLGVKAVILGDSCI